MPTVLMNQFILNYNIDILNTTGDSPKWFVVVASCKIGSTQSPITCATTAAAQKNTGKLLGGKDIKREVVIKWTTMTSIKW